MKASTTNIMAPKSSIKLMTSYKTLCVKRIKAVADAVKEYTGKTLALKQIEHLESIRDNLRDQEERMNQFPIDEHEQLAAATIIYNETITLVESAKTDIQVLIDQAYGELQTASQNQNTIDPNAVGGQRGTPKPKPAKIDDTLKPKAKLTNDMSLLEATEWIKEYRVFMAHNATNLKHHEAKVPRELLEGNIDPVMKLKLRAKARQTSSINDCLDVLDNVFKAKYPAWFRRFEYFQSVQADGESVEDWWSKKTQLEDYCNLNEIKAEDLRVLELIRGVKLGMRMKFLEDGTKPSENEDKRGAPTVDRLLRLARAKETSHMVQQSLSNPKASKISDYKQNQKDKWSQGQSQPQN